LVGLLFLGVGWVLGGAWVGVLSGGVGSWVGLPVVK
jgi:hypothetical protein